MPLDQLPSGSWGFGPVEVTWDLKPNNEIDVDVSVLGITIDHVSGTIGPSNTKIEDDLNVLGLIKGHLLLEAVYGQGPANDGLWLEIELNGIVPKQRFRIVSW